MSEECNLGASPILFCDQDFLLIYYFQDIYDYYNYIYLFLIVLVEYLSPSYSHSVLSPYLSFVL